MRRWGKSLAWSFCLALGAAVSLGQEIRMANGAPIAGAVKEIRPEGLVVETPKGVRTYEWATLSPATRYRYEGKFRANYEAVLSGLPPAARTRPPDVDAAQPVAAQVSTAAVATASAPEPAKRAVETASLKLVDHVSYEDVAPLPAEKIPDVELRNPGLARFLGLQFGPKREDVLYICFDAKSKEEPCDTIFLYSPGAEAFRKTVRQRALKKRVGDEYVAAFKKIALAARFGGIDVSYGLRVQTYAGRPRPYTLSVDVDLAARDAKSSFVLYWEPTDLAPNTGIVAPRGLLDLPVLWVGLDPNSPKPRVVGDLRMSRMKFCPRRGMEDAVTLVLLDADGRQKIEAATIKLDEAALSSDYLIVRELSKVRPGTAYVVRASIDLGPFIGALVHEEKITIPVPR